MADTSTLPRIKTEVETRGQIVIELADAHNSYHTWGPTQERYRGRWLNANVPSQQKDQDGVVDAIGDIPGIRIAVDVSRKRAVIFDALGLPEYADLLEKLTKVWKRARNEDCKPDKSTIKENMSDSDVKSWLRGMRIKLDNNQAIEISGRVPTLEEIERLPGKTRIEYFNSSAKARKYREDPEINAA